MTAIKNNNDKNNYTKKQQIITKMTKNEKIL